MVYAVALKVPPPPAGPKGLKAPAKAKWEERDGRGVAKTRPAGPEEMFHLGRSPVHARAREPVNNKLSNKKLNEE